MSLGGSHTESNTSSNSNQYGTNTPTISAQYNQAYNNIFGYDQANADGTATTFVPGVLDRKTGANQVQQKAIDYMQGQLGSQGAAGNVLANNGSLGSLYAQYGGVADQLQGITRADPRQAQAFTSTAANVQAANSGSAPTAFGYTAADTVSPYAALFGSQVTDPALAAYDYGTMRSVTDLDARLAGSGAFANSRSEIPYSDLITQAALGRGQLSSQLNSQGLTNALGFASQDASRLSDTSKFNVGNTLQNNQFNAQLAQQAGLANAQNQTQNNQFNANQNQNSSQFNVQALNAQDQSKLAALGQVAGTLQAQAGLSSQMVNNIVTANGINTNAAQQLFAAGSITQAQLNSILNAASAYNGYSYTQNNSSQGHSDRDEVHADYDIPGLS